jgi:hypothetical protein
MLTLMSLVVAPSAFGKVAAVDIGGIKAGFYFGSRLPSCQRLRVKFMQSP